MRLLGGVVLTGAALALGGCGSVGEARGKAAAGSEQPVEQVTPTPDAASRDWSGKSFVLRADGLTLASDDPLQSPLVLTFGTPEQAVLAALPPLIGQPQAVQAAAYAHGPGKLAVFGPVTLIFARGVLTGYRITPERGLRLSGEKGLAAGQTCSAGSART